MASVTGLTAERMLEIEAESVVDGEVIGDNLHLTTRGGTVINAGNVRGPEGPTGNVDFPVNVPLPCFGTTAPLGYYLLAGGVYDPIACPGLWGLFGITQGGTAEAPLLPDFRGKTIFGYDSADPLFNVLGGTSGSPDVTLTETELPEHTHTQDAHNHTQDSHNHTQDAHNHTQNAHNHTQDAHNHAGLLIGAMSIFWAAVFGTGAKSGIQSGASGSSPSTGNATATNQSTTATNQSTTATNQSTTATNQSTTATNQVTGGGQPFSIIPPNIALNWIIRAA